MENDESQLAIVQQYHARGTCIERVKNFIVCSLDLHHSPKYYIVPRRPPK